MTSNELKELRKKAWADAKNFIETHQDADGFLTESEQKAYDSMEKKIQGYGIAIDRAEKNGRNGQRNVKTH